MLHSAALGHARLLEQQQLMPTKSKATLHVHACGNDSVEYLCQKQQEHGSYAQ